LFKKVQGAMAVYTSELDHSDGGASPEVLLQDRLRKGRERLDEALEALSLLCEPVQPPKGELEHIHYFCGSREIPDDLKEHEPQRVALYKSTAALVRAFANIADDLPHAGYSDSQITGIKKDVEHYVKLRGIIRQASGWNGVPWQNLRDKWHSSLCRRLARLRAPLVMPCETDLYFPGAIRST
jgi:type I restriction enzyme R subunit